MDLSHVLSTARLKKKKKNPSDFFEHDRDTVGREDNPQQDKQDAVSHFKIQHNPIRGGGATVGRERLAPCWRNARTNAVGSRGSVCRNSDLRTRPIKKFSTGAAARSENSESFLAACSGSGSFSLSGFSLPDATGAHNVHQCVCVCLKE